MNGPTPKPAEAVEELAGDLRALVGLRSRTSVRDRSLPALDALLEADGLDTEVRYQRRRRAIDEALAAIADDSHRRAAEELIADGSQRWQPLSRRGANAAAVFGLGWDGYRRRRASTGSSLLDETILELALALLGRSAPLGSDDPHGSGPGGEMAGAIVSVVIDDGDPLVGEPGRSGAQTGSTADRADPDSHGTGADQGSTDLDDADPPATLPDDKATADAAGEDRRSRIMKVSAIGLGILLVVAAVVAVRTARRPEEPKADPPSCGSFRSQIGEPIAGDIDLADWTEPFQERAEAEGIENFPCAGAVTISDAGYVFQEITTGVGGQTSALVGSATEPGTVIWFDSREWDSLRGDPVANPSRTVGLPTHRVDLDGGRRMIAHTAGVIYRESDATPARRVSGAIHDAWMQRGGLDGALGAPLADAFDATDGTGYQQPFERGKLVRPYEKDSEIFMEAYDPEDLNLGDVAGTVVTSNDGSTSWWVDDDGVRHWLVTGCTYDRMVRTQGRPPVKATHAAIATLPAGDEISLC